MWQSGDIVVQTLKYESFRLIPKVWEVWCWEVFSDSDETKEKSEEDDDDIDFDQVPITRKFKAITCENNSSNLLYILNELASNRVSSPDGVRQRIWDWESNKMTITSNI